MIIFYILYKLKNTSFVKYLLTYKLINKYFNFMEDNMNTIIKYNEKENKLFSQTYFGYIITKSKISLIIRIVSFILYFFSTYISAVCIIINFYSKLFIGIHFFITVFIMLVYGIYFIVSVFLTIKYAKKLCFNSPFNVKSTLLFTTKLALRSIGVASIGLGVVPIDWTCEKAGVKPIFMGLYYPGLKRLAGEVNETLGSQPSKDLDFINENIPGSKLIRKWQSYTDKIEAELAVEYKNKLEK